MDTSLRPEPKTFSTRESALKHDPMWQDFDDEGFAGLTPYSARNEFAVTVEGLISIAERQYTIWSHSD